MSMIDTQNGYDLGYSYCKVCEDWSKVEHDHDEPHCEYCADLPQDYDLASVTADQIVGMLPICPQCDRHGVMDGEMCTRCREAIRVYERSVYHSQ